MWNRIRALIPGQDQDDQKQEGPRTNEELMRDFDKLAKQVNREAVIGMLKIEIFGAALESKESHAIMERLFADSAGSKLMALRMERIFTRKAEKEKEEA